MLFRKQVLLWYVLCKSSFTVVRMPNSIKGKVSVHFSVWELHFREALSCLWNLSIIPLWYDVVHMRLETSNCISCCKSIDSNCLPRSVVIVNGMPNLTIQPL